MRRRTVLLGGALAAAGAGIGYILLPASARMPPGHAGILPGRVAPRVERDVGWNGADFLSGGTKGIDPDALPAPVFRERPNCIATLANVLGPCDADGVPVRVDVSEGRPGLPLRLSLRVVDAATCRPRRGAEVQIWHTDARGLYSGRAVSKFCTFGDPVAVRGLACRGRQRTDRDGVASFLTIYPGWYGGRAVHVHLRVIVEGREALVSQLFFEDLLSDAVYAGHPDYAGRPARDTRNSEDFLTPRRHLNAHIFNFEKLESRVLQATYTVGVA